MSFCTTNCSLTIARKAEGDQNCLWSGSLPLGRTSRFFPRTALARQNSGSCGTLSTTAQTLHAGGHKVLVVEPSQFRTVPCPTYPEIHLAWFPYRQLAQTLDNHLGKVVRIHGDGSAPADNPFVGREGARPEIWSFGNRNVRVPVKANIPIRTNLPIHLRDTFRLRTRTEAEIVVPLEIPIRDLPLDALQASLKP